MKARCAYLLMIVSICHVEGCDTLPTLPVSLDGRYRMVITEGQYPGADSCFEVSEEAIVKWENACSEDIPVTNGQPAFREGNRVTWVFDGQVYDAQGQSYPAQGTLEVALQWNGEWIGTYTVVEEDELLSFSHVKIEKQ